MTHVTFSGALQATKVQLHLLVTCSSSRGLTSGQTWCFALESAAMGWHAATLTQGAPIFRML